MPLVRAFVEKKKQQQQKEAISVPRIPLHVQKQEARIKGKSYKYKTVQAEA